MDIDAGSLVDLLKARKLKLAVAESCTGGFLSKLITEISGASGVFECGVVAYANRIKIQLLGVNEADLENFGAVSEQVAGGMAEGVRKLAGANIGVGITGIAGPLSDNTSKNVGLIYICVANAEDCVVTEFRTDFTQDVRRNNRIFAVRNALAMIESFILKNY